MLPIIFAAFSATADLLGFLQEPGKPIPWTTLTYIFFANFALLVAIGWYKTYQQLYLSQSEDERRHRDSILSVTLQNFAINDNYGVREWLFSEGTWQSPIGEISVTIHNTVNFIPQMERRQEWEWLKQHLESLENEPFWDDFEEWKKTKCWEISAKRRLFQTVIRESGNRLNMNYWNTVSSMPPHEHFNPHLVYRLFNYALQAHLPSDRELDNIHVDGDRLVLGAEVIASTKDPDNLNLKAHDLVELVHVCRDSEEAQQARGILACLRRNERDLNQSINRIVQAPRFPAGTLCASCKLSRG